MEDIAEVLQEIDPEGTSSGFNVPPEELEEQHRVLAGALTLAVERGDAEVLRTLLNGIEVSPLISIKNSSRFRLLYLRTNVHLRCFDPHQKE